MKNQEIRDKAVNIFKKHFKKTSRLEADELTMHYMKYCIDAMIEFSESLQSDVSVSDDVNLKDIKAIFYNHELIERIRKSQSDAEVRRMIFNRMQLVKENKLQHKKD